MNKKLPFAILFFVFYCPFFTIAQITWDGGGDGINWSSANNWNPNGVPTGADDVSITNASVTIDVAAACNNLTIGTSNNNTTVTISGANTLAIGGNLIMNSTNAGANYTLNVNSGSASVAGTVSTPGTGGTKNINITSGSASFTNAVGWTWANDVTLGISSTGNATFSAPLTLNTGNSTTLIITGGGTLTFNGLVTQSNGTISNTTTAGTINFNAGYTHSGGTFTTMANENIYFGGDFTNSAGALTFNATSNAIFNGGTPFITPTAAINFGNFQINSGINVTLSGNIKVTGNWLNNGGTLTGGANTVTMGGAIASCSIGGTAATAFPNLTIGDGLGATFTYTINNNNSCNDLTFAADNIDQTLLLSNGITFTVNGNVIINQPANNNRTALFNVGGGTCTVAGNLDFDGTNNGASRVAKVSVGSGSLTISGIVDWMEGQAVPAEVATEVISVTTGTITFGSSLTMNDNSGTLDIAGAGIVNFNGAAAPSFSFNQASVNTDPILTTSYGCTLNFAKGFTNNEDALIIANGSISVFTGSGTITPNASITFGNLQINATPTVTLAGNISVTGNWTNLGGTFNPSTYGVTFNGTGTQTITKAGGETFYSLTASTTGPISLANSVLVTNTLNMSTGNFNLNSNTLTLGNSADATLTHASGILYNGTFKRWWPSGSAVSSTAAPRRGLFPVGSSIGYCPVEINSTANPTTAGYLSATYIDALSLTDLSPTYNDGGTFITRISNTRFVLSTSLLAGGTYNIDVSMVNLGSAGLITDIRLAVFTGGTTASAVGTHAAATGAVSSPTARRTGLSAANLVNDFRISTIDMAVTPIRQFYYSIASGDWADAVSVWSFTSGGPPCGCTPSADGYATITALGTPVSVNAPASIDFVDILPGGILNGTSDFTVNYNMTTSGSGVFTPTTGAWTAGRNVTLNGTGSSNTPSSGMSITGNLTLSGTTLTLGAGLTVSGDLVVDGTLAVATNTLTLNSNTTSISGTGTISGSGTIFFAGTSSPSYANIGGTGNRTGIIAVSGYFPGIALAGSINELVNGTFGNTFGFNTGGVSIVGDYYRFDFGAGNYKVITEAKWYQHLSATHGTWQWQGSNDAVTWTNIGGTFTLGSPATQTITTLSANTAGYRYYQMLGISGNSNNTVWQREIEFKIDAAASYKNILVGTSLTIAPAISLSSAATVTNYGTVTLQNNLTGVSNSTWTNEAGSTLNITGTLLATGILNASASPNTINYNNAGAQTIKTPSASTYYNLTLSNSGTKTYAAAGTITVSNLVTIQDAVSFNVGTNTLDGAGGLTMTGTSQLIISRNANATFPELTGTYTLTGGTIILAQTANTPVVRGATYYNLTLDGSRSFTTTSLTTVTNDFLYSSTGNTTLGNNLTVGSFTIEAGTLNASTRNITVNNGNWNNNGGTFTASTGNVTFSSSTAQSIGGTQVTTFNDLTIANTSVTGVTLAQPCSLSATGVLTFTDGELILNGNTLTITNSAAGAITGGSAISYIKSENESSILNWDIGTTAGNYEFPFGIDGIYIPFKLLNKTAGTGAGSYSLSTWYTAGNVTWPTGTSLCGVATESDVTDRFWMITLAGYTTNPTADIYFYYNPAELDGIAEADLIVQRWNSGLGTACKWEVEPWANSYGVVDALNNFVSVGSVSQFSPWAMGKRTAPLPIDLLSFNAELNAGVVDLTWATATEINNDYFTIEKTRNGKEFEEVVIVKGSGNITSLKEYNAIDKNPYQGISYYRLKQTDFDGRYTYSGMVAIDNTKGKEVEFIVFPNPSDGQNINVSFKGNENKEEVLVILNSIDGREIYSKVLLTDDNGSFIIAVDIGNRLPAGIYTVTGSSKNDIYSRKLLIK